MGYEWWAAALGVLVAANGCSNADSSQMGGAGTPAIAGAGGGGDSGGSGGTAGAGDSTEQALCPLQPVPRHATGSVLSSFPLRWTMNGKPLLFGQENAVAEGGSLIPLNLRFYISGVELLRGNAEPLPVDVVTLAGTASPYGVHFFNAEQPESTTLHVLAPPGEYSGIRFSVGLPLGCNKQLPGTTQDPLTDTSQMTWPHTGFLFLRYEGRYTAAGSESPAGSAGASGASGAGGLGSGGAGGNSPGGASGGAAGVAGGGAGGASNESVPPPAVHMGGSLYEELVPRVTVFGAFAIASTSKSETALRVSMDEVFKGANSDADLRDASPLLPPTAEAQAGERLRRLLPELQVFSLEP